ncbi:MAG TPA: M17 family peptidase N-terminal domain-containing protein, partial [Nitrospira sp.]|nr:M17 family peptidase N-terminal domain-containing protein [Nitrospira sp.]
MNIMRVEAKQARVDTENTNALVLLFCEGEGLPKEEGVILDRALGGALRELLQSKEFDGKAGEVVVFHTHRKIPAKRLILVGLGKKHELGLDHIRQAMGHAAKRVRHAKCGAFTVALPSVVPHGASPIDVGQTMTEGAILGSYQFTTYRSDASSKDVTAMTVLASRKD